MPVTTVGQWRADGEPWKLAKPIAELVRGLVRRHGDIEARGWHLGTVGDRRHEEARPPEDHVAFSATGWPVRSPYPFIHALDWDGPGFRAQFRFWLAEKRAGRAPWLKYVNLDGTHYRWTPSSSTRPSSDSRSHGHLSIRSDWTHTSIAHGWTTVRRGYRGAGVTALQRIVNAHPQLPTLAVDGVFGPRTEHAVRALQIARHIQPDGIAGPVTRANLFIL